MRDMRYEEYNYSNNLPFFLNNDIQRTPYKCSKEDNWHDDIELEICTSGSGTVLIDGERHEFTKNDIVTILPNSIHYTSTDSQLTYSCIIISDKFCQQIGIDFKNLQISPVIKNKELVMLIDLIKYTYSQKDLSLRIAKLNDITIRILIELAENYSHKKDLQQSKNKAFKAVKDTINYIRNNYSQKLSLDIIAKSVLINKYDLCREFKKITGQTIIEYTNKYRCRKAADYIIEGYSISAASEVCGFENHSFFSKTFKKYMGMSPSKYKQLKCQ